MIVDWHTGNVKCGDPSVNRKVPAADRGTPPDELRWTGPATGINDFSPLRDSLASPVHA